MSQQTKHIFFNNGLIHFKWFDDLSPCHQLAYFILCFLSDNVGVWEPNIRHLKFHLKEDIDADAFLEAINSDKTRIKVLDDGRWWIVGYLTLQAKTLTPNNRPHVSYIEDLIRHDLLIDYALHNPKNVQYEQVYELEKYEECEHLQEKKKKRNAFKYLKSKGLVEPLKEACQTLARHTQESKGKEMEKNTDKGNSEEQEQEKSLLHNSISGDKSFYEQVRERIGDLGFIDLGDLSFEKEIDELLKVISDTNVKDPKQYLTDQIEQTDWSRTTWKEFVRTILSSSEIPF